MYSFNGDVAAFYEWLQRVPPGVLPAGGTGAAAAASAFLRQVAGMTDLVAGEVRHTGTGAADVGLRPDSDTGPVTTVTLRQQADGTWVPAGAHTAAIRIDQPAGLQAISSPVTKRTASMMWALRSPWAPDPAMSPWKRQTSGVLGPPQLCR